MSVTRSLVFSRPGSYDCTYDLLLVSVEKNIHGICVLNKNKKSTDEGSVPKIAQYGPYHLPLFSLLLKDLTFIYSEEKV